ncbi:16S rRNA (adenine(1518)-N(6)/adenine(1519)-N(6))-dimethyltransferase RsmA [Candidatus Gromoviella agglomerans]|uniref:16S rRNA (adenine(1518)-N(6)/adenine(1519)-N(6))- dimethyltransferase RsmA n=1 Tax=Candidatus Gromoviella agglomerans TaxID=2806609 RepID=UPI001E2B2399|nr:16S rRNA (adenine(1518)-N(6)/adenine(1519)-N(6))-dimethyltransferase RsmA [Candidatus Gromoviella agglomerans]UFX98311.1 Ribosomal RNA small subunit methyltransferase A [Candidatus Gromoviella agglomerans]
MSYLSVFLNDRTPKAYIRDIVLFGKKSLGQNFLIDLNVIKRIPDELDCFMQNSNCSIVEIGPGPGIMTAFMAERFPMSDLYVIEKDSAFVDLLASIPKINIFNHDVLNFDWNLVFNSEILHKKFVLIGNLPYNISVPILFRIFNLKDHFAGAVFMFQKEVADRILAKENTSEYGKLSVMAQFHAKIERVMNVNPSVFWPKPKVYSSVLKFHFCDNFNGFTHDIPSLQKNSRDDFFSFYKNEIQMELFKLTSVLFQQRRKNIGTIIRNAVSMGLYTSSVNNVFDECNIDMKLRPENLKCSEFIKLSASIVLMNLH